MQLPRYVEQWSYDRNGNRRELTDARCQKTRWGYDQFDRMVRTDAPADWGTAATTILDLDRNGNVLKTALPRDNARAFERRSYDAVGRKEGHKRHRRHPSTSIPRRLGQRGQPDAPSARYQRFVDP